MDVLNRFLNDYFGLVSHSFGCSVVLGLPDVMGKGIKFSTPKVALACGFT